VDAQWVVATKLAELDPGADVDPKVFGRECLGLGRQMLRQGRVVRPDSVSTELYASALDLADNRGLLRSGTDMDPDTDLAAARQAFRDEIAEVRERLIELSRIEDRLTEELLA
jgi:glycerol-3-phosphate O-acyltransferase